LAREQGHEDLARALLVGSAEIKAVRRLAGQIGWNPASAEARLEQIESEIMDSARGALRSEEREALQSRARDLVSSRGLRMTHEAQQITLNSIEQDLLRRQWRIPSIALLAEV